VVNSAVSRRPRSRTWQQHETGRCRRDLPPADVVLDVRLGNEWDAAHMDGAVHVPLPEVAARLDDIPAGTVWVHCGSGYRATAAELVVGPVAAQVTRTLARRRFEGQAAAIAALDSDRCLALHDAIDALLATVERSGHVGWERLQLSEGTARRRARRGCTPYTERHSISPRENLPDLVELRTTDTRQPRGLPGPVQVHAEGEVLARARLTWAVVDGKNTAGSSNLRSGVGKRGARGWARAPAKPARMPSVPPAR
jgi:hypothetical protein